MANYQYSCKCKHREIITKPIKDYDKPELCKKCGEIMKREISLNSFHLKGGGWFKDGYTK